MLDAGPGLLMLYITDFRPLKPPFAGLDGVTPSVKLESLTALGRRLCICLCPVDSSTHFKVKPIAARLLEIYTYFFWGLGLIFKNDARIQPVASGTVPYSLHIVVPYFRSRNSLRSSTSSNASCGIRGPAEAIRVFDGFRGQLITSSSVGHHVTRTWDLSTDISRTELKCSICSRTSYGTL